MKFLRLKWLPCNNGSAAAMRVTTIGIIYGVRRITAGDFSKTQIKCFFVNTAPGYALHSVCNF
jgi:hypothetical protein